MKTFYQKRGFTLVELLVVIAIIGLLASIVLINLNAARTKAKDGTIKAALSELRAAAEMDYDVDGDYEDVCDGSNNISDTSGTDFRRIRRNILANGGTTGNMRCYDDGNGGYRWCAEEDPLPSGGSSSWCVDYTGYSGGSTAFDDCDINYTCADD